MKAILSIKQLDSHAKRIRRRILEMHYRAKSGHVGSSLSCVELLLAVYTGWLRGTGPRADETHDRFILSKGHAASAWYATLHFAGLLTDEQLATYYRDGTLLPAHPAAGAWPGLIPFATGSLGHGLPVAAGLAFAGRHLSRQEEPRIVCLVSDGECNEGSVWEAALFAAHHRLRNLTVLVDANGLQGFGKTDEVLGLEPLADKWRSFGFRVHEVNGHDNEQIREALTKGAAVSAGGKEAPVCLIARTTKGKGVSFMENKLEWHYLPMTEEQYLQAMKELGDAG